MSNVMTINIIAHRGWWHNAEEKNHKSSFKRALQAGYGIETDIRDFNGDIVISHDIPSGSEQSLDDFLEEYNALNSDACLALNIKSDGLAPLVYEKIIEHNIKNYFVFDMSIPDTISYLKLDMITFLRTSEVEPFIAFMDCRSGVWFDAFGENQVNIQLAIEHVQKGEKVCLVSPELHNREHLHIWESWVKQIRKCSQEQRDKLLICTDFPEELELFLKREL